jgi:hypothetical protein
MKNGYKPRPLVEKTCKHCKTDYMSKDLRQVYCSSSCRVLACYKRNDYEYHSRYAPKPKTGKLFKDIATVAAGSLAADAAKHIGKKAIGFQSDELKMLSEIKNNMQYIIQKNVSDSERLQVLENTIIVLAKRSNDIVNHLNEAQKNKPTINPLLY